jgi:hypothetical protein
MKPQLLVLLLAGLSCISCICRAFRQKNGLHLSRPLNLLSVSALLFSALTPPQKTINPHAISAYRAD